MSGFTRHRRSQRIIANFTGFEADLLRSLASQLVELLRNEAAVPRDDQAAPPVAGESAHCFSIVAHRPYSCMAWTSRSISSRLPVLTTDLPSSWTSIISFSAFFFA